MKRTQRIVQAVAGSQLLKVDTASKWVCDSKVLFAFGGPYSATPDPYRRTDHTAARITSARAPPDWLEADFDQTYLNDSEETEPVPEFEFDQTVSW